MKSHDEELHILYVVQYFNGPDEPGGSRPYQFARRWAEKGHRVTVLTSNLNHKTLSESHSSEVVDGVEVRRLKTYNEIRGSYARRILNFLSFAWIALIAALTVREVDIIYASSTPLTVGFAGYLVSMIRRKPFFFEVRDLWPDSAVVAGVLENRFLIGAIRFVEKRLYAGADKVIAVTAGIRQGVIEKGKDPEDVILIPQGVDDWMIDLKPEERLQLPFDAEENLVCTYIGAHGKWNRLETILRAAGHLRHLPIRFLMIGDGDHKNSLIQMARRLNLTNIHFLDAVPKVKVLDYLRHSDVALIATWDHPFHRMVLANKVFDYMAAGCPIVAAADGEMPELLSRADCGWSVPPERPFELAKLLALLQEGSRRSLSTKGNNGKRYVISSFRRSALADEVEKLLAEKCRKKTQINIQEATI